MKGKAPPKKRANGSDDDQQGRMKSARLAAELPTSAIMTEIVCQASDTDGSSEEEVVPAVVGIPPALPSTQGPSTSVPGTQYSFVDPTMLASDLIFFILSGPMTSHVPVPEKNSKR